MMSLEYELNMMALYYRENNEKFKYLRASKLLKGKDGISKEDAIKIKGIGISISLKVYEFNTTGKIKLPSLTNVDIIEKFMTINGVGPKTANKCEKDIFTKLGNGVC